MVKASSCNAGDPGSIPGSGRSPGEENGNPLWYSCLEKSMDWSPPGPWTGPQSQTRLSDFTFTLNPQNKSHRKTKNNVFCLTAMILELLIISGDVYSILGICWEITLLSDSLVLTQSVPRDCFWWKVVNKVNSHWKQEVHYSLCVSRAEETIRAWCITTD